MAPFGCLDYFHAMNNGCGKDVGGRQMGETPHGIRRSL
jgi:hypothetical protein